MKFSKPFLLALAALPLATTMAPAEAEAKPRCKLYNKVVSGSNGTDVASARVCRNNDDEWTFKKINGTSYARAKLAEHIYDDLWKKGYGVLVDYIAYDDRYYDRRYPRYYRDYYAARYDRYDYYRPYGHAKHHKHKHGKKCDD